MRVATSEYHRSFGCCDSKCNRLGGLEFLAYEEMRKVSKRMLLSLRDGINKSRSASPAPSWAGLLVIPETVGVCRVV